MALVVTGRERRNCFSQGRNRIIVVVGLVVVVRVVVLVIVEVETERWRVGE